MSGGRLLAPVAGRFGEVGDAARDPQKAVETAPGERELAGDRLSEGGGAARQRGVFAQRLTAQLGVGNTLARDGPGSSRVYSRLHAGARLAGGRVQQLFRSQPGHVEAQVEAV